MPSTNTKLKKLALKFPRTTVLLCITMLWCTMPMLAESSALSGLGEPASPASMADPSRLSPESSVGSQPMQTPVTTFPTTPYTALPSQGPRGASTSSEAKSDLTGPIVLRQAIEKNNLDGHGMTLKEAVDYAEKNYPNILKAQAQVNTARQSVHLQKLNEYMPDALFQFQEIMASHNKLNEVFFGSPVFPGITGPAFPNVNFEPMFSSGAGVSLDWAPIDFGLHKARIDMSKAQYKATQMQFGSTQLDVGLSTAGAFLDVVVAQEQMISCRTKYAFF